ncbi:unnamed protein product [Gongylonema pulchrum]|uniref:6-phosphofructokinase n=1 Tax=Gongylonema pulchrum TaxID=637853 RepID=A0A183D7B3_9BILA|nr:unnamed protein product [Gongylonema pulchrum]
MNAAVMSCTRMAILQGCVPYGVLDSIEGLANGKFLKLEWNDVALWSSDGGSHLGTQRELPDSKTISQIAQSLKKFSIHGLILIGGFTAFHSCLILAQARNDYPELCIPMCVVPCTIDNNVPGTSFSLGADTSLNEICGSIDKIKKAATGSKRRVFIIETMGDYCGYLATLAAMASAANASYIFEELFTVYDLLDDLREIKEQMKSTTQSYLIVRSEHASSNYSAAFIRQLFSEEGKGTFSARVNYLGHTQQGGNPSPFDRIQGNKMGAKVVVHIIEQIQEFQKAKMRDPRTATLIGLLGRRECMIPVEELADEADFVYRLPREQWWLKLRPIIKILGKRPQLQ